MIPVAFAISVAFVISVLIVNDDARFSEVLLIPNNNAVCTVGLVELLC